jgi:hypothetical protein
MKMLGDFSPFIGSKIKNISKKLIFLRKIKGENTLNVEFKMKPGARYR